MILVYQYYISQNDLPGVLCSYIFTQEAERRRARCVSCLKLFGCLSRRILQRMNEARCAYTSKGRCILYCKGHSDHHLIEERDYSIDMQSETYLIWNPIMRQYLINAPH